ncbi:MAG: hypothetical protein LAP87_18595 [Acidobacteriia bacterium]|nr:hypothetical protein [Terriglobia bacterium]
MLRAAAVFALVWSIFRAVRQSITLDEADTYLWFGGGQAAKFIWYPYPNNHVLNSLLIWLSTHVFGVSVLTVRIPALLGAALYIFVAYSLCRVLIDRFVLQFAALICLVYNPFILDFFAAARGYTLANAFLILALAVPLWHTRTGRRSVAASAALASATVGLSFVSNFAFAFVDGAALLAIMVWAIRQRGPDSVLRVIGCGTLPVLAVTFGVCGYTITHYTREHLWYGARSLSEMTQSLVDACLYQLPDWLGYSGVVRSAGRYLLLALAISGVCRMSLGSLYPEFRQNMRAIMAGSVVGILTLTVGAHYLAFQITKLPLPVSRTAIFFLPLCTLFITLVAASPAKPRLLRLLGHVMTVVLLILGTHYLLSLRYTYFKEYAQAAEMREVYRVIERLNRRYGIEEFTVGGSYASSLEFYRVALKAARLPRFLAAPEPRLPPGKVYVIHGSYYRAFLDEHKLVVLYRGKVSQVVVAVPPGGPVPPLPVMP